MGTKKIIIPCETIEELYITQNLSKKNVAKILNCSEDTISRHLADYNIPVHKPQDWIQNSKYILSQEQENYLQGALLGDGNLSI